MKAVFHRANWLVAALLAAPLAGCLTGGSSTDERGPQPLPPNYRAELLAFYKTYLTNPVGVREAALAEPTLRTIGGRKRYVACVRYNARESDGRFRGVQEQAVLFVDGRLDRALEPTDDPPCAGAAFAPFPELEKLTR
uniref:Uncharacterized protein n=1 Tax=Rhodopseudomonas palustris (strain BisA53) TaxID=316055 RepID=Q07P33_RHOP5